MTVCITITIRAAYGQGDDGTLSGHIEDPSGAAVAGTVVQLLHVDRNQSSEFKSDSQGRFRFPYLPVGEYEVRIQLAGFQPVVPEGESVDRTGAGYSDRAGRRRSYRNCQHRRGRYTDTRDRCAPKWPIPSGTGEIQSLPSNGRNYLDLVLLCLAC